ncbi:MAG: diguanylate cyclase [Actinobacteria bacterium]|nr:diguanylate cyclase [Actinomycetota bacterium]
MPLREIYGRQPVILIVDDVQDNIKVLGNILKEENYKISAVSNGTQAISIAVAIHPDLILLDVMMPELDGFETCNKLKNIPETKDIPIIFLTAKSETQDIINGFKIGAVDYIAKPFDSYELKARVRTHIELKISKDLLLEKNGILEKLAITDSLTGLYNHRYIIDNLSRLIEENKRYKKPLSISMVDIDNFKKVNDSFGHDFGDEVLIKVSNYIENGIRKTDLAGRYGGEEFLIIFNHSNLKSAIESIKRIIKNMENLKMEKNNFKITLSAGVCERKDEDVLEFIKKADDLLYIAKQKGKNRLEFDF